MTTGQRQLGSYEILREVGRGGMGVVYLARDPKLDRSVAIKMLPAEVANNPEPLARFQREARVLASLNHPSIAGIHGLDEDGDNHFLVLEYVDGPTLAERVAAGPLPIEETLDVCRQIADALEAAHEAGVIHRDLKPANIKLTSGGNVKVLDFGLAKNVVGGADSDQDLSMSPTLTGHVTSAGVILGTAAYMSPEQARGKAVDRRTDIWSFGCVLFECLTGKRLFRGDTVSDTIALILREEPDWSALPDSTPPELRTLVQRCLEKDPKKRQRDIGDARLRFEELEFARTSSTKAAQDSGVRPARAPSQLPRSLPWILTALIATAAVVIWMQSLVVPGAGVEPVASMQTFQIYPPNGLSVTSWSGEVVISPDGGSILWESRDDAGDSQLWLREMNSLEHRLIPMTSRSKRWPCWSPDGRSIAFFGESKLMRMELDGGDPQPLCDANSARGVSWGKEFIFFAMGQGPIYKVPASGGDPEPVTQLDSAGGETAHRFPHVLPDGETFLYVALPPLNGRHRIFASDVHGMEPREITSAVTAPVYAEPGYLLFQIGNQVVAQRFDAKTLELGEERIVIGPAPPLAQTAGSPAVSASRNGHLAFLSAEERTTELLWLDRDGTITEVPTSNPGSYSGPAVSPDGRHVALTQQVSPEESDIWVFELERSVMTRLTFGPGKNGGPIWSPDGRSIAFSTDRNGPWDMYEVAFPGGGEPEPIIVNETLFKNLGGWSPDGKQILYAQIGVGTNMDLWIAPANGDGAPEPYLARPFQENMPCFSPDGRWVAYTSHETGDAVIYANSFPDPGRKSRISTGGGNVAMWPTPGEILFFGTGGTLMQVRVSETGGELRTEAPVALFTLPPGLTSRLAPSPDGSRFFGCRRVSPGAETSITVVLNWESGLLP